MNSEITHSDKHPNLPAEVSTEIRLLMISPAKYLEALSTEGVETERPPGAITLLDYKRGLDRNQQLMYLSMMIAEVNDFFNVKGNMNAKQIRLTAELIADNPGFYDLTLGNIKACFRQKMMTARLYDRLDGNILIGWLREFKSNMADHCEDVRVGLDRLRQREEENADAGAITYATYTAMLEARANDGDQEAAAMLNELRKRSRILSEEERRTKDLEFFKFKQQYLKSKQSDR